MKSINSDRNPLTPVELEHYTQNKKLAAQIRKHFLDSNPKFRYARVYTEPRTKGGLRSKFWLVNLDDRILFLRWMEKHYSDIKVEAVWSARFQCVEAIAFFLK